MVRGRRIRLRYAHQGGRNPPLIIVHGNQTERLPQAYRRYLVNAFRKRFDLDGTPVRIEFRSGKNPYAGRRNTLTPRQQRKRSRLLKQTGKSKK
jgi:GTP-binding protein